MTQALAQAFNYKGQEVRTVVVGGEPWFVAIDVCSILDLGNPRSSLALLDDDEKGVHTVDTPGGPQQVTVVSEAGLYSLILRSRKPEAKTFKRWITHEVLPSIRKTGSYGIPNITLDDLLTPEHLLNVTQRLVEEHRARLAAEEQLALQAPKVALHDTLMDAQGDYSLREAAQILSRDPAIETGQNRLARYLREIGWTDRKGIPYQAQIDTGRLAVRTRTYEHPHTGEPQITTQIRITPKGLAELHRMLGGRKPLALDDEKRADLLVVAGGAASARR